MRTTQGFFGCSNIEYAPSQSLLYRLLIQLIYNLLTVIDYSIKIYRKHFKNQCVLQYSITKYTDSSNNKQKYDQNRQETLWIQTNTQVAHIGHWLFVLFCFVSTVMGFCSETWICGLLILLVLTIHQISSWEGFKKRDFKKESYSVNAQFPR